MSRTVRQGNTLWVRWPELTGQTLIGRRDLQPWIDAIIDGVGPDGAPVEAVNFVFTDPQVAAYNHDSLTFARVGVFLEGDPPTRFASEHGTPDFQTREDAGIPRA